MSLIHDGTDFGGITGSILEGQLMPDIQRDAFPGLKGVSHLIGETRERELSCSYIMQNFAFEVNIRAQMTVIARLNGKLTGTLTDNASSLSWPQCTFLGMEVQPGYPKRDAATNTWFLKARLRWIQRIVE